MNRRILLADDSLTIQKVVELTFADTDFEVFAVSSGDELVAKLPEIKPDIVICDVIMPGRDGYDVCQEIKSDPDSLHLPVILLTGTFEPFDRDRALAVGCSEIITKPFEAKRLVEAVEKLISGPAPPSRPVRGDEAPATPGDGRVTPPPPIVAPDVLVDVESDYELTAAEIAEGSDIAGDAGDHPEEALEFTETGFSEMEAAGQEQAGQLFEPPAEGLEFELEDDGETAEDDESEVVLETSPFHQEEIRTMVAADEPGGAADDPFAEAGAEGGFRVDDSSEVEVFPTADEPVFEEPAAQETERQLTTPINVAEAMSSDPELSNAMPGDEVALDEPDQVDHPDAETQDFGVPRQEPVPDAPAPETPAGLSDDDIDRIARRLLELAGDRIDRIAWEVLPDMAEIVVRERVREIESEIEGDDS